MNTSDVDSAVHLKDIGLEMHRLMAELYPISRSITGDGVRETLGIIGKYIPIEIHNVPTGTQVFDCTVPPHRLAPSFSYTQLFGRHR
jgi:aminopeptidase-like protein